MDGDVRPARTTLLNPTALAAGGDLSAKTGPKVAVLMAVYRGDRLVFVRESVASMLGQDYGNFTLFVFEDGPVSPDVHDYLETVSREDPRCRLLSSPLNRGLAVCLNDLIAHTRDEFDYFARMDADDVSVPNRLSIQVAYMQAHPGIDVLGGGIFDIDESGKELKQVSYPLIHDEILRLFRKRTPMAHVTVMFRPSYFTRAGLYPPIALEDGLYWMQGMAAGCRFENVRDFLVKVRRTDDFLLRRSGWRKAWQEFVIKVHINRRLRLGIVSQCYAIAMFGIQISPLAVKRALYSALR